VYPDDDVVLRGMWIWQFLQRQSGDTGVTVSDSDGLHVKALRRVDLIRETT
jgi:hypothetical protein